MKTDPTQPFDAVRFNLSATGEQAEAAMLEAAKATCVRTGAAGMVLSRSVEGGEVMHYYFVPGMKELLWGHPERILQDAQQTERVITYRARFVDFLVFYSLGSDPETQTPEALKLSNHVLSGLLGVIGKIDLTRRMVMTVTDAGAGKTAIQMELE